MLEKVRIARARFESDEDAVLAEAVQNAQRAADPLTDEERVVYYADQLLGNLMMDGHQLTLYNCRDDLGEFRAALQQLGATRERNLLEQALRLLAKYDFVEPDDAPEDLTAELDALDQQLFASLREDPDNLEARTKRYVRDHLDAFVTFE